MFQSSPVPKDGCNAAKYAESRFPHQFQSSPVPKDGCNLGFPFPDETEAEFQSSPVPKDGCNWLNRLLCPTAPSVSILTRPEGRVQRCGRRRNGGGGQFQSSPVPKDGCNSLLLVIETPGDDVSILTRPEGRVQRIRNLGGFVHNDCFNPHPSRRTGATTSRDSHTSSCTLVSILTRPEGRVQLCRKS